MLGSTSDAGQENMAEVRAKQPSWLDDNPTVNGRAPSTSITAVRQQNVGMGSSLGDAAKEIPSMVWVTLDTKAANRSEGGSGFMTKPLV
jgi:hypothetical protein